MRIKPRGEIATRISASNAEKIVVRGRDLTDDLIGQISFTAYTWLLLTGETPSPVQQRMLDATLVAIAEHGLTPSVAVARMTMAAAPEALQGAVAAGLLGCGSVVLGSSQAAGEWLAHVADEAAGGSVQEAAHRELTSLRARSAPVPGFGHPLHKREDPRVVRLLALAQDLGVTGRCCQAGAAVEAAIPGIWGRELKMNVSGAIPAVLLDAGFPKGALKGVPLLARAAGLIAHLLEEQATPVGFRMAQAAAEAIPFAGEAPEGFVADEG